jgi:alkyldihydroxyacetonephosphate synthase
VLARPSTPYPDQSWRGWGDPDQVPDLPEAILTLLRDGLGVRAPRPAVKVVPPAPRLSDAVARRIAEVCEVADDPESRLRHTRGKSTPDLLLMRAGDASAAPDLVLLPDSHEQVLELLRICSENTVAVVPFGGGSSVVGGLEPRAERFAGVVALDTRRLDGLLALDEESRLAELQPGLRGPQAEQLLAARGYTIGHFPQSFEYATLGGFAAARSSGQASAGYGRFDDVVVGLKVATPAGTLELGRAPKTATGPDLRQLILGSEGTLGVITALTVQVRPLPEERVYEGWRFESFAAGAAVLRRLAQDGPLPTVLRLSDEAETAIGLARPAEIGAGSSGSLAIVGYEGTAADVAGRQQAVTEVLEAAGAVIQDGAGEAWARDRYRGPYLRDALLDAGALVERQPRSGRRCTDSTTRCRPRCATR